MRKGGLERLRVGQEVRAFQGEEHHSAGSNVSFMWVSEKKGTVQSWENSQEMQIESIIVQDMRLAFGLFKYCICILGR